MTTIDQKIAEYLNNWQINGWPIGNLVLCIIALVLTVVLCGIIGLEREYRGRNAGLRTLLLVGVGSCVIMIISIYGFPASSEGKRDVARLAAQIITGVGFLGAGAIMTRSSGSVRGLTTAATIWAVMAIGIACGSFNFILAIVSTGVIFLVLTVFMKFEVLINKAKPMIIITATQDEPVLCKILAVSRKYECTVHGLDTSLVEVDGKNCVKITFQALFKRSDGNILEYVSELEEKIRPVNIEYLGHM